MIKYSPEHFKNLMIQQNLMLSIALKIAMKAHDGQFDKAGEPYILHPLRVALHLNNINEKIVAILHDVVEDTGVTIDDLVKENFTKDIIDSVKAMTRNKEETYEQYLVRVKKDSWAKDVKIEDLRDNMDPMRIAKLNESTQRSLVDKYSKALYYLNDPL